MSHPEGPPYKHGRGGQQGTPAPAEPPGRPTTQQGNDPPSSPRRKLGPQCSGAEPNTKDGQAGRGAPSPLGRTGRGGPPQSTAGHTYKLPQQIGETGGPKVSKSSKQRRRKPPNADQTGPNQSQEWATPRQAPATPAPSHNAFHKGANRDTPNRNATPPGSGTTATGRPNAAEQTEKTKESEQNRWEN